MKVSLSLKYSDDNNLQLNQQHNLQQHSQQKTHTKN